MFNPTVVVIDAFIDELIDGYVDAFGEDEDNIQLIASSARNALEIIANSDAPYHDIEHTMHVTLVGMEILRGKALLESGISRDDWVHFVISLLNHDIGSVRGICTGDRNGRYVINSRHETMAPAPGSTDAVLTPYHVDRAKQYLRERFSDEPAIDEEVICRNVEHTRFPVPAKDDHIDATDYPGLLRAADLIGQLADPGYMRKISALFAEFRETGQAAKMGYTTAADLRAGYPKFFWDIVAPFISEGIRYLRRTQEGQAWVANLYANVFTEEHEAPAYGPERRATTEPGASGFKVRDPARAPKQRRITDLSS